MNKPLTTIAASPPIMLKEEVYVRVHRHIPSGGYQIPKLVDAYDLIVNNGRVFLAQRIGANVNSPMAHMAVGSGSTATALANTALVSESARKALAVNSALTNNVYSAVSTFGGNADSVTSVVLQEAGLFNHASSGQGTMFQRVTYASVTLADSDLLSITLQTNVGSNTI